MINRLLLSFWIFLPIILNTRSQCPANQSGQAYLKAQYNPAIGLISEAPNSAPNIYWLTNDNALAAYTFAQLGDQEFSRNLTESINNYDTDSNGLIEILWGEPVVYPPYVSTQVMILQVDADQIWQEYHLEGARFEDWAEYANLAFLGALNIEYQGDHQAALQIYSDALQMYDGTGFTDKAFDGSYETYKLALALYSGSVIGAPIPNATAMLETLLNMQYSDGGFFTHYTDSNTPTGDTNTETTSFALLALNSFGCEP